MKTISFRKSDQTPEWHLVDATDQTLGRLASQVATVLRGKHKPTFTPHEDLGDHVIVINASKVRLTGNKLKDKMYRHHTGFIGGIKEISAEKLMEKDPTRLITFAVTGMLPKTKLGRAMAKKLRVYADGNHQHQSQKPVAMTLTK
ncbi:MAG: 50S ribosomal protein L13 [Paracoccaceae bacterium]|nr:50S ribosomal protein L13 [Paracoccaceae bacterium]MDH5527671.1 50S ribosomal protein L13 [Nitrospirota bacterium]